MTGIELTGAEAEAFGRAFLKEYMSPSLGAMSKREVDLLIFRLLATTGSFQGDFSAGNVQAISRRLCIPVSKVKLLYYETQLRTVIPGDIAWLRENVFRALNGSRLKITEGNKVQIEISITNPLVREELIAALEGKGAIVDSSFRREILRLYYDNYVDLLDLLATKEERKEIVRRMAEVLKSQPDAPTSLPTGKDLYGTFLNALVGQAGRKTADLSFGLLTGGLSELPELMSGLFRR